jgi:hypothetical protein
VEKVTGTALVQVVLVKAKSVVVMVVAAVVVVVVAPLRRIRQTLGLRPLTFTL